MVELWVGLATRVSPEAADRQNERILERCETHAQFPTMAPRCEELGRGLRNFPVGRVVVFYRPRDDGIEVIRVIHGARNLEDLFGDED